MYIANFQWQLEEKILVSNSEWMCVCERERGGGGGGEKRERESEIRKMKDRDRRCKHFKCTCTYYKTLDLLYTQKLYYMLYLKLPMNA